MELENRLLNLPQRPPELGRIRLGEKGPKGEPVRLRTFRLTSGSKPLLDAAAVLYGGTVTKWDGAPDEGFWQLTTGSAELDILIPGAAGAVSQSYELWKGGTCERRCDGTTEAISAAPCICAASGQTGPDRECDIRTRVNVMLPRLPGLGVWRLDTGGYMAATTLPSTLTLLAQLSRGSWIPAVLRAEQRSKKVRDDKGKTMTHRFVVPVLDLPGATIGQLAEGAGLTVAMLEPGEPVVPSTARDKVAAARALIEAAAITVEPAPEPVGATETPAEAAAAQFHDDTDIKVQCPSTSPYEDAARCRDMAGHPGMHRSGAKESWE